MNDHKSSISILGTGWLGFPLVEHFIQHGYQIRASTRTKNRLADIKSTGASAHIVDIENCSDNILEFLNSQILIINITSKNIDAFKQLVSTVEKSTVEKVIFISSTSVYKNLNRPVTEDEAAENTKCLLFQIENLFRDNRNFETTVVRFSGLLGYNRHPGRWFQGGRVVKHADAPVNMIHRDDCIAIIYKLVSLNKWGEVFNASADTHPIKRVFYTHARKLLALPPPEFSEEEAPAYKIVSNEKLKSTLDYCFKYADVMEMTFD